MIKIENVTKKYKKKKYEIEALKDISVSFGDKGLYFLLGKSGSGKSTMLSILAGIDNVYDGNVYIDDKRIKDFTRRELEYFRSTYIGYVFQDYNLISELSAYDNVKLGADVAGNFNYNEIDEIFTKLDIVHLKDRRINELSGGEKQRIAIARTLIKHPRVILADEPTGALDGENAKIIMDLLYSLSKEYLVIVVTHNEEITRLYEASTIILSNGEIQSSVLQNEYSQNKFIRGERSGLSKNIIKKIGFEILLHKKVGLFFSLIFTIVSVVLFSIAISGASYNENKVMLNEIIKNKDYVIASIDRGLLSEKVLTTDIEELEQYNQNMVYSYSIEEASLEEEVDVSDYYMNISNKTVSDCNNAFEYNESTIDMFGLKVIEGSRPQNQNECAVTKLIADEFIENDYKFNGISKSINSYSDLIGMSLFGYEIVSILDFNNSNYYQKVVNEYKNSSTDSTDFLGIKMRDIRFNTCAYSIFTYNNLYHINSPLVKINNSFVSNEYLLGDSEEVQYKSSIIGDVIYSDNFNIDAAGAILNINLFTDYFWGYKFDYAIDKQYETYRNNSFWDSYSDDELYNYVYELLFNKVIEELNQGKSIEFTLSSEEKTNYSYSTVQNIIGVIIDSETMMYVDNTEVVERYVNKINSVTNVNKIFSNPSNSKDCLKYITKLLQNYRKDYSYKFTLSNEKILEYMDYRDVFNPIKIISLSLSIIFLAISVFVLYKYVNDSINFKEKEIGVLKAVGVSWHDIFKIFSIPNIIISLVIIVVSVVLQYPLIKIFNVVISKIYGNFVESFNIVLLNWISIVILGVIVPLFAAIIPITKSSRKNPKDILNN